MFMVWWEKYYIINNFSKENKSVEHVPFPEQRTHCEWSYLIAINQYGVWKRWLYTAITQRSTYSQRTLIELKRNQRLQST